MSENESLEVGLRIFNTCDPKEVSRVLLNEVFPNLRYKTIYRHFGRKLTIFAVKNQEGLSFSEAARFVDEKSQYWTHDL